MIPFFLSFFQIQGQTCRHDFLGKWTLVSMGSTQFKDNGSYMLLSESGLVEIVNFGKEGDLIQEITGEWELKKCYLTINTSEGIIIIGNIKEANENYLIVETREGKRGPKYLNKFERFHGM